MKSIITGAACCTAGSDELNAKSTSLTVEDSLEGLGIGLDADGLSNIDE